MLNHSTRHSTRKYARVHWKMSRKRLRWLAKCHVEVTTLVIPGFNDSVEEMDEIARWLGSVSPEIVLHLSRYFPRYKMNDRSPTPVRTLENLRMRH